jgi:hypothetical protein
MQLLMACSAMATLCSLLILLFLDQVGKNNANGPGKNFRHLNVMSLVAKIHNSQYKAKPKNENILKPKIWTKTRRKFE